VGPHSLINQLICQLKVSATYFQSPSQRVNKSAATAHTSQAYTPQPQPAKAKVDIDMILLEQQKDDLDPGNQRNTEAGTGEDFSKYQISLYGFPFVSFILIGPTHTLVDTLEARCEGFKTRSYFMYLPYHLSIQAQVHVPQKPRVVALYDFDAENPDELTFKEGDVIELTDKVSDPEWWKGEGKNYICCALADQNFNTRGFQRLRGIVSCYLCLRASSWCTSSKSKTALWSTSMLIELVTLNPVTVFVTFKNK